jgi:hypothetical protein
MEDPIHAKQSFKVGFRVPPMIKSMTLNKYYNK